MKGRPIRTKKNLNTRNENCEMMLTMEDDSLNSNLSLSKSLLPSLDASAQLIRLTTKILTFHKNEISVRIIPYRIGDRFRIFDYQTKTLSTQDFDDAYFLNKTLFHSISCIVELDGSQAIVSNFHGLSSPNWYDKVALLNSKIDFNCCIVQRSGLFGVVNDLDEIVLPLNFTSIEVFAVATGTYLKYQIEELFGLFHLEMREEVIPIKCGQIFRSSRTEAQDILIVSSEGRTGVFDLVSRSIDFLDVVGQILAFGERVCGVGWDADTLFAGSYLVDLDSKSYINDLPFDSVGTMRAGFSLCVRNHQSFVVYRDGREKAIGEVGERYKRNGNVLFIYAVVGKQLKLKTYLKDKFINEFLIDWAYGFPSISVKDDSFIQIANYRDKYQYYSNVLLCDLDGSNVRQGGSYPARSRDVPPGEEDKLRIEDTEWRIDNRSLFFRDKLIYQGNPRLEELDCLGFYSGVSMIEEIFDIDPEFGCQGRKLGYVDLEGNIYWED